MRTVVGGVRYEGCPGTVRDAIANNHPLEPVGTDLPERSRDAVDDTTGLGSELLSLLGLLALLGLAVLVAGLL